MKYYIADTHFGHKNIIKHSNRPFSTVEEMDKAIVDNWNRIVSPEDEVYIIGDFCFKSAAHDPIYYLEQLNGIKYLVIGNHDRELLKDNEAKKHFRYIRDMAVVNDLGTRVILCHYPMVEWNGYFRDTLHFYGHIHNNTDNLSYKIMKDIPNAYNTGADILDFSPRTLGEVIEYNQHFIKEHFEQQESKEEEMDYE